MSKNTQGYILFNMMKAAGSKGVTKAQIAQKLGVKETSIGIYLFGLRKFFKAEFETVKNGRQVVAYKLLNADKIDVPAHRKGSKVKTTKVAAKKAVKTVKVAKVTKNTVQDNGEVATLDSDTRHLSDREFTDIKASLGLD